MSLETESQDEKFIRRCIELSQEAVNKGDKPFGSVITKDGQVIAEASNDSENRVNYHAEILALNKTHDILGTIDLSDCVLYSNCEPCPMCSFMLREFKVGKVVFAARSLGMGGYSKWGILQDEELERFAPYFSKPPEVIAGLLEDEALEVFNKTPLWMFGSPARTGYAKGVASGQLKNNSALLSL